MAAAGAVGVTSHAEAALYWPGSEPGLSQPDPAAQPRKPKARKHVAKKGEAAEKESSKPQGPVIISISIDQQRLRLYDANGLFAETPISTGMRGHPTPMGVFSVIQKDRLHHSNIYSGAPMPYMQRITWSGIAIHAGVLPGYPASHGCIRMPMAFAMKMWNWTRMGARVVVTPGDISPANFSHPLLATMKVAPQPMAADEPKSDAPSAAKTDKAADVDAKTKPAIADAAIELRSTIGHADSVKPAMDEAKAAAPLTEPTRTADASNTLPASNTPVMMSDAGGGPATPAADPAIAQPEPDAAKPDDIASSDDKSTDATSSDATSSGTAPAEIKTEASASADAVKAETAKVEASASEAVKVDESKAQAKTAEVKADDVKAEAPKADAAKSIEKPAESKIAAEPAAVPPARKDQGRPAGLEKAAATKLDAPKRSGQIAVFVSRKDSKLYVRQNFTPLYDVPVTIAASNRPLGTHVFTAQVDKADSNLLHWSVVTLPASRAAERRDEDERSSRRRKIAGAIEVKSSPAPDSPAEALDRLNLPAEVLARITEALSTGGSLIVSDQGIAGGETGEGTDFIVSLR